MMQDDDADRDARMKRVQQICQRLTQLVSMSREQRRTLDDLLAQLEALDEQARTRPLVRTAGQK